MNKFCILTFVGLITFTSFRINAQQPPTYTLESLINLYYQTDGYQNLLSDSLINRNNQRLFLIRSYPTLELSATLANLNNGISPVIQPTGQEVFIDRFYSNSNVSLSASQLIPFTGGTMTVTSSLVRLDNFLPSKTTAYNLNMFNVAYSQNLSGYNSYRWEKKKSEAEHRINDIQLTKTKEGINGKIVELFFKLLAAQEEFRIKEESIDLARFMMEKATLFYSNGKISYEDYLDAKIDFKKATIGYTRDDIDCAREELISFLNMKDHFFSVVLSSEDTISIRNTLANINEDMINERVYMFSVKLEKDLSAISDTLLLKQLKSSNYPAITLSLGGGLNSRADEFLRLFGQYYSRINVSVSLSIPILDWGKNRLYYRNQLALVNKRELEYKARASDFKHSCHHDLALLSRLFQEIDTEKEVIKLLQLRIDFLKKNAEYGKIEISEVSKVRAILIQSQIRNISRLNKVFSIIYKYRELALIDIRTGKAII